MSELSQRLSRIEPPLRSPRDRHGRFVNYAKTVRVDGLEWAAPADEEAVSKLVAAAAAERRRVRLVGAGHSWSPIAAPEDVAVSLDAHRGIVAMGPGWVTVRAGTRLRHLYRALDAAGRSLPIVASIAQQSAAGAIATGTHGSSLVHGNLSSLVVGARLVTADGTVVEVDDDDERLDAVRVHLGALGAVTELTFKTVPAFRLAQTIEAMPVSEVGPRLVDIGRSAEYVKVWWMPHTDNALVFRYERTDDPASRYPSAHAQRVLDNWLQRAALPPIWEWQRRHSGSVPALNRIAYRWLVKGRRVGPAPLMLTTPEPIRHHESEAAVALADSGEAFSRTVSLVDRLGLHVNFILEARFVAADTGWMSSASGRDVVHLGACTAVTPDRHLYFDAFWDQMRPLGGRPHWAKEMDHSADEIRSLYPMAGRFEALRDEWDPDRVFSNSFLEHTLGS